MVLRDAPKDDQTLRIEHWFPLLSLQLSPLLGYLDQPSSASKTALLVDHSFGGDGLLEFRGLRCFAVTMPCEGRTRSN